MRVHVDGKTYDIDQDSMLNVELMAIEQATGFTTGEWSEALKKGSMLAITGLIWIIQKRVEPTTTFDEVVFRVATLELEADDEEEPEGKDDEGSVESS